MWKKINEFNKRKFEISIEERDWLMNKMFRKTDEWTNESRRMKFSRGKKMYTERKQVSEREGHSWLKKKKIVTKKKKT